MEIPVSEGQDLLSQGGNGLRPTGTALTVVAYVYRGKVYAHVQENDNQGHDAVQQDQHGVVAPCILKDALFLVPDLPLGGFSQSRK